MNKRGRPVEQIWDYSLPNIPLQKNYTTAKEPYHPQEQQQIQYERFVKKYNKCASKVEKRRDLFPKGARGESAARNLNQQTGRLLRQHTSSISEQSYSELVADNNWSVIKNSVKQSNVWNIVRRFVQKMKQAPIKKKPPNFVNQELEHHYIRCDYSESEGWDPWRPDVIFNEITQFVFNSTAVFLFSTRMVLYKVDMDIFPILYLIVIAVGAFYRMNTKILYRRNCIVKRKEILSHYLLWHSVLDGTIIYLSILEYCQVDTNWYRIIIFFKAIENKYILNKLEPFADIIKYGKYIFRTFIVYVHMVFIAHCVAIILIASVSKDKTPNWMSVLNLSRDQDHWITVYIRAYYWASTTLVLDSYGDTTPKRTKQIILIILIETFGIALTAYWLGTLQTIYNEFRIDVLAERKNTRLINRFLETNKVPYSVQRLVKKTVHKMSISDLARQAQEENLILDKIPAFSKARLLQFVHSKPISTMTMFNKLSKSTVMKVAAFIQRKLFYSREVIVSQGDIPQRFIMLRNGRVREVYLNVRRKVSTVRNIGQFQGAFDRFNRLQCNVPSHYVWLALENSLVQTPSPVTIRSKGQSMILSIEYSVLEAILKQPDRQRDYESFCAIRDQVLITGIKLDSEPCSSCQAKGHGTLSCPYYHYIPKKQLVVLRYLRAKNHSNRNDHILQPRLTGRIKRRPKLPWIKIQIDDKLLDNTVTGNLTANHGLKKGIEQYRSKRLSKIKKVHVVSNNIGNYLTTLNGLDSAYEFQSYFLKWNASKTKIVRSS